MIPLMLRASAGTREAADWRPTEQPGLAVVHIDDRWYLVHIRSGLSVADHPDRLELLYVALPLVGHLDFTLSAAELGANRSLRRLLITAGVYTPNPGRVPDGEHDIDQDPALANLTRRPA